MRRCRFGQELPYAFVKRAFNYHIGTSAKNGADTFVFD
jgi:hypothetical protein